MAKRKQSITYLREKEAKKDSLKGFAPPGEGQKPVPISLKGLQHTTEMPESTIELLVKKAAEARGNLSMEDAPYLEQYMHPDFDILEKQKDRPSKGGPSSTDREYRRVDQSDTGYNVQGLGGFKYDTSNPKYDSIYDIWDFDTESPVVGSRVNKSGISAILPSLEDYIAKEAMKKVGKPYSVYERVPKGTREKKYFKD